ncbi:transposase, partial [Cereibacter sediminicola]|uniref:transposase n=1 Tax=Cereibacter sediminicola TaxID=2584941 RepID=UPI001FE97E92
MDRYPGAGHRPEEIVAKLRQVDVLVSQGRSVAEAVRPVGVTKFTYFRWREEFSGLKIDEVKRLKELDKENERPRCEPRRVCRRPISFSYAAM